MSEFKARLRVSGKDVDGNLSLAKALSKVTGIGINMADNIALITSRKLKIDKNEKIGNLSESQIEVLEGIISDPISNGIPVWSINRVKDPFTGENRHLVEIDYKLQRKVDSEHEKDMRSYKGIRYMFNLPVRGQRTKTSGRKGKTMGVNRKKPQPTTKKKSTKQQPKGGAKKKKK